MPMSLSVDDYTVADFAVRKVHGMKCLGFGFLRFETKLDLLSERPGRSLALVDVCGTVNACPANGSAFVPLGNLVLPNGFRVTRQPPGTPGTSPLPCHPDWGLELALPKFSALERARSGGSLRFALKIKARFQREDRTFVDAYDDAECHVDQSEWIKAIGDMGYQKMTLIEVPLFDEDTDSRFALAGRYLQDATLSMRRGDWREAVGKCRSALEAAESSIGDGESVADIFKTKKSQRDLSRDERLMVLRKALLVCVHPAQHGDATSSAIVYTAEDASAFVTLTAAVLRRLAHPDS